MRLWCGCWTYRGAVVPSLSLGTYLFVVCVAVFLLYVLTLFGYLYSLAFYTFVGYFCCVITEYL